MKTETIYDCGKCESGSIKFTHTENNVANTIFIAKCNKCKYQYGIKELFDSKLTPKSDKHGK